MSRTPEKKIIHQGWEGGGGVLASDGSSCSAASRPFWGAPQHRPIAQGVCRPVRHREPEVRGAAQVGSAETHGEEEITHSSILACKVLWTEEPGGLPSMGSQRVRHN